MSADEHGVLVRQSRSILPLADLQVPLCRIHVVADVPGPGADDAQSRTPLHDLIGKRAQPAEDFLLRTAVHGRHGMPFDQTGRRVEIGAASACRIASSTNPCSSYHRLARR